MTVLVQESGGEFTWLAQELWGSSSISNVGRRGIENSGGNMADLDGGLRR